MKSKVKSKKRVIHTRTAKPVSHYIQVDVLEIGKSNKLKTACFYPDGSHAVGKYAERDYPTHMEPHISASRRGDKLVWRSSYPFTLDIKKNADVFTGPPLPWESEQSGGVHTVTTGTINKKHPTLLKKKPVKAKFAIWIRVSANGPATRTDIEPYDPHFVVDP